MKKIPRYFSRPDQERPEEEWRTETCLRKESERKDEKGKNGTLKGKKGKVLLDRTVKGGRWRWDRGGDDPGQGEKKRVEGLVLK